MFSLKDLVALLEEYAPLALSEEAISLGGYDNSGIIVESHDKVEKVLFSLDLSDLAVKEAVECGADTLITHHPAIYYPIKSLSINDQTSALLNGIKNGFNVISMHLNLDMAKFGVDYWLAEGLGANKSIVLQPYSQTDCGYGREFEIDCRAEDFVKKAKESFGSDKIVFYGEGQINKVASFCGGGSEYALKSVKDKITSADTIVTSDVPHHVLKELIESGKKVLIIPHYVSEQYGFNKFYVWFTQKTQGKLSTYYFRDKRFM